MYVQKIFNKKYLTKNCINCIEIGLILELNDCLFRFLDSHVRGNVLQFQVCRLNGVVRFVQSEG